MAVYADVHFRPVAEAISGRTHAAAVAPKNVQVCLLGASFDTHNMGVSALAESSIKAILSSWPDANVRILGGRSPGRYSMNLFDREVCVENVPLRFCRNVFLPDHYCRYFLHALLFKLLRSDRLRRRLAGCNPYVKAIHEADVVVNIVGGDSFSEIYGLFSFVRTFMTGWLVILFDKRLVMLPQTYGPFNHSWTRALAKYTLRHAGKIYSRDVPGLAYVKGLLGRRDAGMNVEFCPDVAFVLDAHEPCHSDAAMLQGLRRKGNVLVGLNVSGLLWNGGHTRDNMFALGVDYPGLVRRLVEMLLQNDQVAVLLVPHVFAPDGAVESDPQACRQIYESTRDKCPDRVLLVQGEHNQNQLKYLIGQCDFFIGSRMHSCIAALSQCVPAVGLAYSRKFHGVFESVGVEQFAVDLRNATTDETLAAVASAFEQRETTAEHLKAVIPGIQSQVLGMFSGLL
jgi:polysaccharide pyruvyl transferase WcaK-like protein